MDLKSFVSETITQIVEGVDDAKTRVGDKAVVNAPVVGSIKYDSTPGLARTEYSNSMATNAPNNASIIQFDVAVTATSEAGKEAGGKLAVSVISIGGGASSTTGTSETSRIKFSVPVSLTKPE